MSIYFMKTPPILEPIKTLLNICLFLVACVLAPTLAAIVLLGGTGYAIYTAAKDDKEK